MVAGLLRVLIKVMAAAAIAAVLLTLVGHYLRQLVPEPYHRAVWLAGLLIWLPCFVGAALVAKAPAAQPRRFENLLMTGAVIGALLFVLFVTDVECALTQTAYGRLDLNCRYQAEP